MLHYNFCLFPNSFDRIKIELKGRGKKGTSIGTNTKKIEPRDDACAPWSEEFNIPNRAGGSGWVFNNGENGAEDFSKFHHNFCMFPNLFDRIRNWTKGISVESNTKKIKAKDDARVRDHKSSIFSTGLVVAGGHFIMWIIKPETFWSCITLFVCSQIQLTE